MDSDNRNLVILCLSQFGVIFFAIGAATVFLRFWNINELHAIAMFLNRQGWILIAIPLLMAATVPYLRSTLWVPDRLTQCIMLLGLLFTIVIFFIGLRLLLTPIWPHGDI